MRPIRPKITTWLALVPGLLLAAVAATAAPVPLGAAFPLNPDEPCGAPPCSFAAPTAVGAPGGRLVASWVKNTGNPFGGTLLARGYRPTGAALQPSVAFNDPQTDLASPAALAFDPIGEYLIAWSNTPLPIGDVVGSDLFVRRLNGQGIPVADAIDLTPAPQGGFIEQHYSPAIAMAPDRGYVVAWSAYTPPQGFSDVTPAAIVAQRFDATDQPVHPAIKLNTNLVSLSSGGLAACTDSNGGAVAVWVSTQGHGDLPASGAGVSARRLAADATVQGPETIVAPPTGQEAAVAVGCSNRAAFLVVWQSDQIPGTAFDGILAQRFTQNGNPILGGPQRLDAGSAGNQKAPALSRAPDGTFVVVWMDESAATARLVGRHVDPFGAPLSDEFEIATGLALGQSPTVAHYGTTGTFLVAWQQNGHIFARRYAPDTTP